jgi:peptidoglycan hydrolase-like protein with peptidoglycan-binding domain
MKEGKEGNSMKTNKNSILALGAMAAAFAVTGIANANGDKIQPSQAALGHDEIVAAQNKLNEKGYSVGKADGVIGKQTMGAIKKFQKDNKEPVTGQLNSTTLAALGTQGQAPTQQSGMVGKDQPQQQQQPGTAQDQSAGQSNKMDQNNYPAGNNSG